VLIQIKDADLDNALIDFRKYRFIPLKSRAGAIEDVGDLGRGHCCPCRSGDGPGRVQLARRALIFMVGLTAGALVASWFILRNA